MHVRYVALLSGYAIRKIVEKLGHVGDIDQMQLQKKGNERMTDKKQTETKKKNTEQTFNVKDTQKDIVLRPFNWSLASQNTTTCSTDMVNHPPHYASSKIECIDAMLAMSSQDREFKTFLNGHEMYCWQVIFKYIWRFPFKNDPLEDLKKAKFYLERLINSLESKK